MRYEAVVGCSFIILKLRLTLPGVQNLNPHCNQLSNICSSRGCLGPGQICRLRTEGVQIVQDAIRGIIMYILKLIKLEIFANRLAKKFIIDKIHLKSINSKGVECIFCLHNF